VREKGTAWQIEVVMPLNDMIWDQNPWDQSPWEQNPYIKGLA